ncbi:MAG TPA: hypothetical protein VMF69_29010 [Gemmataceae bacterium]|nr:hypothetical protein [Gemmataceae bacterium]
MAGRSSHPWFYAAKNAWYVWHNGKKVALGVRGAANKNGALKAWHRLLANGRGGGSPLQPPETLPPPLPPPPAHPAVPQAGPKPFAGVKAEETSVAGVLDAFFADAQGRVGKYTAVHYEKFCRYFKKDHGTLEAEALTADIAEAWARAKPWSNSTRHDALGVL